MTFAHRTALASRHSLEDTSPVEEVSSSGAAWRPETPGAPKVIRIAYLLSRYPAISHTFFLHEVLGLRAEGLEIETISINSPDRSYEDLPTIEQQEADRTYYVKGSKKQALQSLAGIALKHPGTILRGLRCWCSIESLTLRERLFWLFYLAEGLIVGEYLKQKRISHLHIHFGGAVASVGMLTAIAWQIPYSLTIHGPEELLNTQTYHLREKTANARFVICISDFCRSQLYQLTPPEEWHKFHVVRLGVTPTQPCMPTAAYGSSARTDIPDIVCTGRLVAAKGHRILLEAALQLHERDVAFQLTIVGDGPERGRLEAFIREHGLAGQVTFLGALSHPQTIAVVRQAALFVLPSFAEGIPVAIMEAMSFGIPCISTTIAGIPELIESGVDGLLVPPANPASLATAMESLLRDTSRRQKLGDAARRRILASYNLPLNHKLLAEVFAKYFPSDKSPLRRLDS